MVNVFHILWDGNLGGIQKIVEAAFLSQNVPDVQHHAILLKKFGEVIPDGNNRWALEARNGFDAGRMKKGLIILSRFQNPILHFHNDCRLFHHIVKGRYKTVITEHGEIFFHPAQRKLHDWFLGSQYRNADVVCCVSNYIKQILLQQYPTISESLRVRYNPLLVGTCRSITDPSRKTFALGYIGRISEEKGVMDIVPLCRMLPEIPFYIIGDGPLLPSLQQKLAGQNNVIFTGFIQDITTYLEKISLLVVPSYKESFNMAIIEAMAYGTPSVAYATGGIPEIIDHDQNGWLVPAGAVQDMAETIRKLSSEKDRLISIIPELQRTVEEKYSLAGYQHYYDTLYRSMSR